MEKEQALSQQIDALLKRLQQAKTDYNYDLEQIKQLDLLIDDYLHALEFSKADCNERTHIATAIQQCRYERRPYKDEAYLLEPLVRYLKSKQGNTLLNLLEHVRELALRVELAAQHKEYQPRVMAQAEYDRIVHKDLGAFVHSKEIEGDGVILPIISDRLSDSLVGVLQEEE